MSNEFYFMFCCYQNQVYQKFMFHTMIMNENKNVFKLHSDDIDRFDVVIENSKVLLTNHLITTK